MAASGQAGARTYAGARLRRWPPGGRPSRRSATLVGLLALASVLTAGAHPTADERLARLTRRLEAEPERAGLYVQRAGLHRERGDWEAAATDLDRARHLDPQLAAVDLTRARLLLDMGETHRALQVADTLVRRHPHDPRALVLRGHALLEVGSVAAAAADLVRAAAQSSVPSPDLYLSAARAFAAIGRNAEALATLDAGLGRLGHVPALEIEAIAVEVQLGEHAAALRRIERAMARAPRPEAWLPRRAEVLAGAGSTSLSPGEPPVTMCEP
jgi:tetratricopeptide (TPR) repeat protein